VDHQAEARIEGRAKTEGRIGLHASVSTKIVVPLTVGFGPPPSPPRAKEMKVDISKVSVQKKS